MYKSQKPSPDKGTYSPANDVQFELNFLGEKLVKNSVMVSGNLKVYDSGAPNEPHPVDTDIFYDNLAGIHGFFENVSCSFGTQEMENFMGQYPRWVRMRTEASYTLGELMGSASQISELKSGGAAHACSIFQGASGTTGGAGVFTDWEANGVQFCFKPDIMLNNMMGDLSYTKSGPVTLRLRVALLNNVLYGDDVADTTVIELSNLMVHYQTVPEDGKDQPVQYRRVHYVDGDLNSNLGYIHARVPAIVNSMSCSFSPKSADNDRAQNSYGNYPLPDFQRCQFLFNDSSNQKISFPIDNYEELFSNYLDSLNYGVKKHNSLTPLKQQTGLDYVADQGFGIGVFFDSNIDLTNQSVAVQIDSGIVGANPYTMHSYFSAIEQI